MHKIKALILFLFLVFFIILLWWNIKYKVVAFHIVDKDNEYQYRVMTWNICGAKIKNKGKQIKIAELIIKQDADFVQLNEFCLDSCFVIDSILSAHYPFRNDARSRDQVGDVSYSIRPLLESNKYRDIPNTIISKLNIDIDSLCIIGCHLTGNNYEGPIEIDDMDSLRKVKTFWERYRGAQEKRNEHAHLLKISAIESLLPIIVMGDMNDFNCSAPMDSLNDAGMKNAWWEGGFGYGATYHEGWLRLRIDHIYYNDKLKLKDVKVVETDLSDHNILVADFEFAN